MTAEFRRGEKFVYRHVAGEHLLVALHRDRSAPLFAFTPTAAAIWDHLTDWRTASALADFLVERFDVSREQATGDVNDFLEQLNSLGAVDTREVAS